DQDRTGTRRKLPARDGRTCYRRRPRRASDVAPGHRRLSGPDDRDGFTHAYSTGENCGDRSAKLAAHSVAQPLGAAPPQRLRDGIMAQTLETTQQEGLLDALARKWRIWQRRRAAIAVLDHCGTAERQRIANDI